MFTIMYNLLRRASLTENSIHETGDQNKKSVFPIKESHFKGSRDNLSTYMVEYSDVGRKIPNTYLIRRYLIYVNNRQRLRIFCVYLLGWVWTQLQHLNYRWIEGCE
jgi:hypothetical protein